MSARRLGYVRPGVSVGVRDALPVLGPGCKGGFVGIEPRGYVCLDRTATLDRGDHFVRAAQSFLPVRRELPFEYALSNGTPMYWRLPRPSEAETAERWFGPVGSYGKLSWGNRAHAELAEARPIPAHDALPDFLRDGSAERARETRLVRRTLPHGSMLAYSKRFDHAARTWLLAADGSLVPADRVRPFRVSDFAGLVLDSDKRLPAAFTRAAGAALFVRDADGTFRELPRRWRAKTALFIDGPAVPLGSARVWPTSEHVQGRRLFVADRDLHVIEQLERPPFALAAGEKWLLISITRGTLTAYAGLTPVFATLISPGAGGVPRPGVSLVKASTTPLGVYRITFKLRSTTMSPDPDEPRRFWIDEVPHTQYFAAPFALHAAYWHEDFGVPKSAGCINLSPRDAAWLFDWTEPHVPDGWSGAIPGGPMGKGTTVVITR
ncbi:MAG TPA: L,D-transpeptidase [Polyangiaceae bacterium]